MDIEHRVYYSTVQKAISDCQRLCRYLCVKSRKRKESKAEPLLAAMAEKRIGSSESLGAKEANQSQLEITFERWVGKASAAPYHELGAKLSVASVELFVYASCTELDCFSTLVAKRQREPEDADTLRHAREWTIEAVASRVISLRRKLNSDTREMK